MSFNPSRARGYASDASAREFVARAGRFLLVVLGLMIMLVGLVLAALPGHLGLPILVVGLMLVLRNSFKARRRFVRVQRAHPKMVFPLRRLMRREPEIVQVAWQQALRVERLVLPRRYRALIRGRHMVIGRRRSAKAVGKRPLQNDGFGVAPTPCTVE
jgi:hypothetical protein